MLLKLPVFNDGNSNVTFEDIKVIKIFCTVIGTEITLYNL